MVIRSYKNSKGKVTSKKVASTSSKLLKDGSYSKNIKTIAASALSQKGSKKKVTSKTVAKVASKVLKSKTTSKKTKSVAGSVLAQKPKSYKNSKGRTGYKNSKKASKAKK